MSIRLEQSIVIREVWHHNLHIEFETIAKLISRYSTIFIDVEFPGCVYQNLNIKREKILLPIIPYHVLKMNVDLLNIIQLGFTLTDSEGNLPLSNDGKHYIIWQFNFRDFNILRDSYAPDSINWLKNQGINFERNCFEGIDFAYFSELIMHYKLICNNKITWVTFQGAYDFGYLIKILTRCLLPNLLSEFLSLKEKLFGSNVYDVKYLTRFCSGLYGGLRRIAVTLQIKREIELSQQAGSDSHLISLTFYKIKRIYFNRNENVMKKHAGVLYGLELY
ncbi:hypothetical protein CsatA_005841 [Cannabis sativa]